MKYRIGPNSGLRWPLCLLAATLVIVAIPISLDVTDSDGVTLSPKAAFAGKGGGGNGGGGGGNGGGGNSGGGNAGGGNAGGNAGGNGGATASTDGGGAERSPLLIKGVALAQFTTRISKRRPADEVRSLGNAHQPISFYTEVQGMKGRRMTHRWLYRGTVRYETAFDIRGDKWRFWSTQLLPGDLAGRWQVEVVDESGAVLEARTLDYRPGE